MTIPIYQLDSFADRMFSGNPAAVCPLTEWLEDETLQSIALENNLSETAFFLKNGSGSGGGAGSGGGPASGGSGSSPGGAVPVVNGHPGYHLRWFTPGAEVDLCGHATLASAWVILNRLEPELPFVRFSTRSGDLVVVRQGDDLVMDFPAAPPVEKEAPRALVEGLGDEPVEVLAARRDYLVVYENEEDVRKLRPDFARLRGLDRLGVIVTAPGTATDFVSRFFAPSVGVPEDPVTGSAHCTLTPYWAERLGAGENWLTARQVSARGGNLGVRHRGERVDIAGSAVLYMEGTLSL
ncbi:MAG: PhzF family phenazine biosynthesis protein [Gemmatimonadota bacterium]|nr:PhzF family phenazine biosynthesis protein [Gemmatimonadota bacterium]